MNSYICYFLSFILLIQIKSSYLIDTSDCEKTSGCFREPNKCENSNCQHLVKWKDFGDSTQFTLVTKTLPSDFYFAVGFSTDEYMGNDNVVIAFRKQSGYSTIGSFFNYEGYSSEIFDKNDIRIGLSEISFVNEDNYFYCSFNRKKSMNVDNYFNLDNKYYLLIAKGDADFDDPNAYPTYHEFRLSSSELVDFSSTDNIEISTRPIKLAKAHGILMMFSWMFLSTLGILFARYYKYLNSNKTYFGVQLWFVFHRSLMVSVTMLSLLGLLLILIAKNWKWTSSILKINFTHSIIGILTISFSVFQPIYAVFRPGKDAPNRGFFNWAHRLFGILTYVLSIVSVFLGSILFFSNKNWMILIGWVAWLVLLIFLLEISEYKIRSNEAKVSNEKTEFSENDKRTSLFNRNFKSFILVVHIVISSAFAVAIMVLISTI
ncbi:unnamed protein product [Brachionus calyciflorus]|uniref:Ferric-chelate reductase 1 n=1 Tax=Brachionus calyciflorus TaxID=104777 RepID=A0A813T4K1_9BILA|nr:unnamed protein product [Brachionus calyciflorus]